MRLTEQQLLELQNRNKNKIQSKNRSALSIKSKPTNQKPINFGNRGMVLEDDINLSNEFYLAKKIAVIHKKPTPIQIVKVEYPQKKMPIIKEAYFRKASTTDYNGLYRGYYIDFEAKETDSKTSFPLSNFEEHQVEHMASILECGGIAFAIIRFSPLIDKTFLIDSSHIIKFWKNKDNDGRKSIPFQYFEENAYVIKVGLNPILNFLPILDEYYLKEDSPYSPKKVN